ncbi:hypothetical protein Pst134EA_021175 [Puccinia striiformis f. sp. tritici]|uniref:hypothetical protein n=1 Tax=Puccinia striiformis f. sp. tritici TaxID=168172 RepID=UPI002007EC65|nr:hypothetical protein Pst134EA_021175 [Puccinia striiformis f. sp. tritici]KAH9457291.1 hypothetical protein Pst134EA_021175 [Puccinia striiformis f. sp. tritici]
MPGLENLLRGWYTLRPPGTAVEKTEKPTTKSRRNPDKNAVGRLISIVEITNGTLLAMVVVHFPVVKRKSTQMTRLPFSSDQLHQYNRYGSLGRSILSPIAHQDEMVHGH